MKREHVGRRDCWCDPYIVHPDQRVIAPPGGRIAGITELTTACYVAHVETDAEPQEGEDA
jgi:hypothetical protein